MMGFDNSVVQFLGAARKRGVKFGEVGTLGWQSFFPSKPVLDRVLKALDASPEEIARMRASHDADTFLQLLGARRVDSIDYSAYENATIIQDLNGPLSPELSNRFDVVIDGGTIEHVFNVPLALKNAMRMVRVGGWFIQIAPANNQMGHGFWQYSPELMFRCFSPENGFDPPIVLLKEISRDDSWHEARDPNDVRRRVELRNFDRTYICVLARKREDVEPFTTPPYQSDYVAMWEGESAAAGSRQPVKKPSVVRRFLRAVVPGGVRLGLKVMAVEAGFATMYAPSCYRRIPLDALLRGEFGPPVEAPSQSPA